MTNKENELEIQFTNEYKTTRITEPPYSCGIVIMEKRRENE